MHVLLFKLAPHGSRDGISCDARGAFIGSVALLKRIREHGRDVWVPRNPCALSKELRGCFGLPIDMAPKADGLAAIARALNGGDVARAQMLTLFLRFPDPAPIMKAKPDRAEVVKFVDQLIESDFLETKSESPKLAKFNQNHRPAHAPDSRGGQFAPKGEGSDGSAADGSQSPQLQLPVDAPTTAENVRVTAGETDSASYGTDSFGNTMSPEVQSQINQAVQHMDLDTAPAPENDHRSSGQAARSSAIGPHGYIPAQGDANLLARALFAEGGKTPRDMAAIAWSIINRIGAPTFRDSLTGVLHQSGQFAFLPEGGGPPKGSKEWQHSENPETLTGAAAAAWQNAQSIANGVFAGSTPDPTGGATGYFSWPSYNGTPGTAPPSWRYPLRDNRYSPSPYTSSDGNYFFVQNPANVWHSNRHRGRH